MDSVLKMSLSIEYHTKSNPPLVGDPLYCYVVKLVLVEIGYVVLTSMNFGLYNFLKIPKIVLSEDPLYK